MGYLRVSPRLHSLTSQARLLDVLAVYSGKDESMFHQLLIKTKSLKRMVDAMNDGG